MSGILFVFVVFILIFVIAGWVWYLATRKKMRAGAIALRMTAVSVLFTLFLFIDMAILITVLWEGDGRKRPFPDHEYFHIINKSSVPLLINANFAYSRNEIEMLQQKGISVDPVINFVEYKNISLPDSSISQSYHEYSFALPMLASQDITLPKKLYVALCDTSGNELFGIDSENINTHVSKVGGTFIWLIDDHLFQIQQP